MKAALIIIIVISAYGIAGYQDAKEEADQLREYCEMVEAGHWGAYSPEVDCNKVLNEEGN